MHIIVLTHYCFNSEGQLLQPGFLHQACKEQEAGVN